ncbi:MAG: hypothetical protein P8Z49_09395 [Acidobacteriota bacterium]
MKRVLVATFVVVSLLAFARPKPHSFSASGGHGWIRYWGTGKGVVSGEGTLTIRNISRMNMKMDGTWGEKQWVTDGGVYKHFKGKVTLAGLGIHVEIRGWNLSVKGEGFGKAHCQGEGTYQLDDEAPVQWKPHPFWVKVKFRR